MKGKQTGNAEAVARIKEKAAQRAKGLQGIIAGIKRSGIGSVRAIAEELNRRGISAPRGGFHRAVSRQPHGQSPETIKSTFAGVPADKTMDKEPSEPNKKQTPYFEDSRSVKFHFNRRETDAAIGALKILIFDSCRDGLLKLRIAGR
jgi:hypothetical protein